MSVSRKASEELFIVYDSEEGLVGTVDWDMALPLYQQQVERMKDGIGYQSFSYDLVERVVLAKIVRQLYPSETVDGMTYEWKEDRFPESEGEAELGPLLDKSLEIIRTMERNKDLQDTAYRSLLADHRNLISKISSSGPDGRNYTNEEYLALRHENERMQAELVLEELQVETLNAARVHLANDRKGLSEKLKHERGYSKWLREGLSNHVEECARLREEIRKRDITISVLQGNLDSHVRECERLRSALEGSTSETAVQKVQEIWNDLSKKNKHFAMAMVEETLIAVGMNHLIPGIKDGREEA